MVNIKSSVINLVRPFPRLTVLVVILTTIASLMEGISLSLAIPLLQKLLETNNYSQESPKNFLIESLTNFFNQFPTNHRLMVIMLCLLALVIAKGIVKFFAEFSLRTLQLKVGLRLRLISVNRFLNLGLSYYSRVRGGDLLSYVNEHTQRCEMLTMSIGWIFSEILIICILVILLLSLSWKLTLVATILLGAITLGLKQVISAIQYFGEKVTTTIEDFSSKIMEMIGGIRIIKSFTSETYELACIEATLKKRYQSELQVSLGQSMITPLVDTLGIVVLLTLLMIGMGVLAQDLVLPVVLTFLLVLLRLFPRVNSLNRLRAELASYRGSFDSIHLFLEQTKEPEILEGIKKFRGLKRDICFENLTFAYGDTEKPVLDNINLTLYKGTVTALVGASGSGKSTLTDLLMRFYDPQAGRVTIDGVDLKEFNLHSLRKRMAVVSQENFLFNATVWDNIRYGNHTASEEDVIEAVRQAYAEDFINSLPEKFNTMIGDRGVRLSGGQRQRLAIARAILRNPEILILDEATSALDSNSETIVQKALDEVRENRTVLVISHRLSTIRDADQIAVLKQGKIVEVGRHEELLALEGVYYKLHLDQSLGYVMLESKN